MKNVYDLLIIGGGVSGCLVAYSLLSKGYKGEIAIVEHGRNLGGRSSSRISLRNNGIILNHGSANFNILESNKDKLINKFLNDLLQKNLITFDDSQVYEINSNLEISLFNQNYFYQGNVYRAKNSMSDLLAELINEGVKKNKIKLFFNTLITNFEFKNNKWIASSIKEKFHSKFLISSSNLILHNRSLQILKKENLPIREAIPEGKNKNIDKIINFINKQDSLKRVNYLIYPNKFYTLKKNNIKNNIHFLFNQKAEKKFGFERIIFQKQESQKIGIVIHTRDFNYRRISEDINNDKLIEKFNFIFKSSNLINKLEDYEDISIMRWRSSQPSGLEVPMDLQICQEYKIAFCGDWFESPGFGRIEGAINSALTLSKKITKYL